MKKRLFVKLLLFIFIFNSIGFTGAFHGYAEAIPEAYIEKYEKRWGYVDVTIKLTTSPTESVKVYYHTADGSALGENTNVSLGKFFDRVNSSVTFNPGETTKVVSIQEYDPDSWEKSKRYFYFQLQKVDGKGLIKKDQDLIYIEHLEQVNTINAGDNYLSSQSGISFPNNNYTRYYPDENGVSWPNDYWKRLGINSYNIYAYVHTWADDADCRASLQVNGESKTDHHNDDGGNHYNTLGPVTIDGDDTVRIKSQAWNAEAAWGGDEAGTKAYNIYGRPIDNTAPTIKTVIVTDGEYGADQEIIISVVFSEIIEVTDTSKPGLPIQCDDGTVVVAPYQTGSGTDALVFKYVVPQGKSNNILALFNDNRFYGEAYVKDLMGNVFSGTIPSATVDANVSFNGKIPAVSSMASNREGISLRAGETIDITVNFTKSVKLLGDVTLKLNNGDAAVPVNTGSNSDDTHVFRYTITETSADTNELYVMGIDGGTILDNGGNPLDRTIVGNPLKDKLIKIDNTPPTITLSPDGASVQKQHEITIGIEDNGSGEKIAKYIINNSSATPNDWTQATDTTNGQKLTIQDGTGKYYIHVYAQDIAGNEIYKDSAVYPLDNTAPAIGFSPNGDLSPESVHHVSITLDDVGSEIDIDTAQYKWQRQGTNYPNWRPYRSGSIGSVSMDGLFDFTTGFYELVFSASDTAGNETQKTSNAFFIDKTPPNITVTSDNPPDSNQMEYEITLIASDPNEVAGYKGYPKGSIYSIQYRWEDDTEIIPQESNGWSYYNGTFKGDNNQQTGNKYLHVMAMDGAGNSSYNIKEFVFDHTPITINVSSTDLNGPHKSATADILVKDQNNRITDLQFIWRLVPDQDETGSWNTVSLNGTPNTVNKTVTLSSQYEDGDWYLHVMAATDTGKRRYVVSGPYSLDNTGPLTTENSMVIDQSLIGSTGKITITLDASDNYTQRYDLKYAITEDENYDFVEWFPFVNQFEYEFMDKTLEGERKLNLVFKDSLDTVSQRVYASVYMDLTAPAASISYDIPKEYGWTKGPVKASLMDITDNYSILENILTPHGTQKEFKNNGSYDFKVVDQGGNESVYTAVVDWIDSESPTITLSTEEDMNSSKSKTVAVSVYDNVTSMEDIGVFALWSSSKIMPEYDITVWEEVYSGEEVTLEGMDGDWYLHIIAEDHVGNVNKLSSGKFVLDNTPPKGHVEYSTTHRTASPVTAALTTDEPVIITNPSNGSSQYTFTDNGTFTFEYEDSAGNKGISVAEVDWFDFTLPTAKVSLSTTDWTNENITVTASVYEGSVLSLYDFSFDGDGVFKLLSSKEREVDTVTDKVYALYEVTYEVGDVGNFIFHIKDLETQIDETIKIPITNIDKVPPSCTIAYSETVPTKNDVMVNITPTDNTIGLVEIDHPNGAQRMAYGQYKFSSNGVYLFTLRDKTGNEKEVEVSIQNIDKTPPVAAVRYDITGPTNQNVTASVYSTEEIVIVNNGGKHEYIFEKNGRFTFEVEDLVGNRVDAVSEVTWIDKTAPVGNFKYSTYEMTNQDITIEVQANEALSDIAVNPSLEVSQSNDRVYIVHENGTYTFTLTDMSGNQEDFEVVVNNIDKTPPQLKYTYIADTTYGREIFQDAREVPLTNKRIQVKFSCDEAFEIEYFSSNVEYIADSKEYYLPDNGTYTFTARDLVGNTSEVTILVDTIDLTPPRVNLLYSTTQPTAGDVTVEVVSGDDDTILVANNMNKTKKIFRENGKYTFIVRDLAGNVTRAEAVVNNIDRTPPNVSLAYSTQEITNQNVTVTVKADEEIVVLNNGGNDSYTFEENGSIRFWVKDLLGNESQITALVTNIDKEAPEIGLSGSEKLMIQRGSQIDLRKDVYMTSYADKDLPIIIDDNGLNVNEAGEYEITYSATDKAGNTATLKRVVEVIDNSQMTVRINGYNPETVNSIETDEAYIEVYNVHGNYEITYLEGRVSQGQIKLSGKKVQNNKLVIPKTGWYTFIIQDQERNRKVHQVFLVK